MALGEALAEERFDDATACFGRVVHRSPNFSTEYFFQGCRWPPADARTKRGRLSGADGVGTGFRARIVHETWFAPVVGEKFLAGARILGLPE